METLLTTDENIDSKISVNFWNPTSGTKILSVRGPPASSNSLSILRDEGILVSEAGKPFIHVWQSGHPLQTSRRILCPGKPGPLALSPSGSYLAVGIDEKISIWQIGTGKIVTVINSGHYRPVSILKFNTDGTYLLSGGGDGMILAFRFGSIVSKEVSTPKWTWSDHSFPITGIHVGIGGPRALVFSSSLDRTSKIYSLGTGTLLLSISFPLPLTGLTVDGAEFGIYVGTTNGTIYQTKLHTPPRSIEHHVSSDAGADGVFKKHDQSITCLSVSADAKTLASADSIGLILLWDTESRQAIRTIGNSKVSGKITNLRFWLGNPELIKGGRKPKIIFPEVPKLVESAAESGAVDENDKVTSSFVTLWNRNPNPMKEKENFSTKNSSEESNLRQQISHLEGINKKLYEFCVDNVLSTSKN